MIEAFSIAKRNTESDYRLLIAGGKRSNKYYNEITNIIKKLKLKDSVILLGVVSKKDLLDLYSSCKFFIFPSPCENFAYTLVEAMCCGAAILCSNTTAMPETCQEAAMYFDPNNTKEMAEKIELLISNEELRKTLNRKSLERVKQLPAYKDVTLKTLNIMFNISSKLSG
jgi:glycosyltransferase involved in cell wall biosynthesis